MEQQNNVQDAVNSTQNQAAENANPYYVNAPQNTNNNPYVQNNSSFLNSLTSSEFLKGALIGATVGFLLTNEKAQKTIFKTVAKGTQMLQMGVEEMKERYEDAKAEMESQ